MLATKVLAKRVSSHPMDACFLRNTLKIHLISYNFMGKHMPSVFGQFSKSG